LPGTRWIGGRPLSAEDSRAINISGSEGRWAGIQLVPAITGFSKKEKMPHREGVLRAFQQLSNSTLVGQLAIERGI
jgi:hypothetical protein